MINVVNLRENKGFLNEAPSEDRNGLVVTEGERVTNDLSSLPKVCGCSLYFNIQNRATQIYCTAFSFRRLRRHLP